MYKVHLCTELDTSRVSQLDRERVEKGGSKDYPHDARVQHCDPTRPRRARIRMKVGATGALEPDDAGIFRPKLSWLRAFVAPRQRGGGWYRCRSSQSGAPNRLGRGHRQPGRRRWADALQHTTEMQCEAPWQVMAQDRAKWPDLEPPF